MKVVGVNKGTHLAGKVNFKVPFRDLRVTDPALKAALLNAVDKVLSHGQLLLGPEVELFESTIAEYCGTRYCVGMASGTDALYLALRSVGIGPGDEVITTPLSWIATLNAIHICGGESVFVDITEDLNINADLIEEVITPRTKAILPVHFTGRLCDMRKICAVANKYNLLVIEDAAQAYGAYSNGTLAGAFGDVGAFSFNPMKVLPGYGEAGAVLTNDKEVYDMLIALRYLGTVDKEVCYYPSLNAKIDTLQAAMMMVSMNRMGDIVKRRNEIADYYSNALQAVVTCPQPPEGIHSQSAFFDYTIIAERRDELQTYLERHGVETKIKHPILMPHQPAYAHLSRVSLPVAERIVKQILSLPIHEKLTAKDIKYVADTVRTFYNGSA